MKLKSKEICPVEVRDKLISKLAPIDNGISDLRFALETAEEKCFELDKENEKLSEEKYRITIDYVALVKEIINSLKMDLDKFKKLVK